MIKINISSSHTAAILNYVLEQYVFENIDTVQHAPVDLFDDKGRLLLIKGEKITTKIQEQAKARQLFTLHATGDCSDMFREVNLISVEDLLEACQAIKTILTEVDTSCLANKFEELLLFDKSIYEHCMNVASLAYIIGKKMGKQADCLKELTLGALLHDFGKMLISPTILNKASQLTPEEYEIMKCHPGLGEDKLAGIDVPAASMVGITMHHERWDGRGYPRGLKGNEIPLNAQIIAVADVFDAITADRPYRAGLPPHHALELLVRGMDADFSPDVVKTFAKMLKLYPDNAWVTLNTGEVGTVTGINMEYPTRPTIRLLFDKYGEHVADSKEVDLCKDKERFVCTIKYLEKSL